MLHVVSPYESWLALKTLSQSSQSSQATCRWLRHFATDLFRCELDVGPVKCQIIAPSRDSSESCRIGTDDLHFVYSILFIGPINARGYRRTEVSNAKLLNNELGVSGIGFQLPSFAVTRHHSIQNFSLSFPSILNSKLLRLNFVCGLQLDLQPIKAIARACRNIVVTMDQCDDVLRGIVEYRGVADASSESAFHKLCAQRFLPALGGVSRSIQRYIKFTYLLLVPRSPIFIWNPDVDWPRSRT